jgi:hypothetical protein
MRWERVSDRLSARKRAHGARWSGEAAARHQGRLASRVQGTFRYVSSEIHMSKSRHRELKLVSSRPTALERTLAGKVTHDSRGNAVWDWAIDTNVLSKKSSTELLRKLDEPQLSLEGEVDAPQAWHGDPYNRTAR